MAAQRGEINCPKHYNHKGTEILALACGINHYTLASEGPTGVCPQGRQLVKVESSQIRRPSSTSS